MKASTLLLLLGLASLVVAPAAMHEAQTRPVAFDRTRWLGETRFDEERNWRNRMAEDVVRRWVRPHMTKAQVRALLGPAEMDPASWFGEESVAWPIRSGEIGVLRYETLEHEGWMGCGEEEGVFVYFDRTGHVARALIDATRW